MKNWGRILQPAIRNKAIIYFVAIFLISGIATALLESEFNPFIRMIPATFLDYVFLFSISLLGGIYLAIPGKCNLDKPASLGGLLGFLSFACPICNSLLVAIFGTYFLLSYFDPIRPVLGVISILIFIYLINKKLN